MPLNSDPSKRETYPILRLFATVGTRLGFSSSMVLLGAIYESGAMGPAGIAVANTLYRQAADKGNAQAMYNLGVNHLSSKGFETDHEQALYWLKKAAGRGHGMALWAVGKMYLGGRLVEKDVAHGMDLLRHAGRSGCRAACLSLVDILRNGTHEVAVDNEEAARWMLRTRPWRDRLMVRLGLARVVEK